MASICNGLAVYWFRWELPTRADLKWVISRSLLEDLHWYLAVVAVLRKIDVRTQMVIVGILNP